MKCFALIRVLKSTLALAAAACVLSGSAAAVRAALLPGDIAIIGVYTDGTSTDATGGGDSFAWAPLVDLAAGEVIHFSDVGYYSAKATNNGFGDSEGLFTFTTPAGGIAAGVVQTASNDALPNSLALADLAAAGTGYTTGASAYSGGAHVNLSGAGDQLVAFQDADLNDTAGFASLFAVTTASTKWTPDDGVVVDDSNQTELYPGLVDGATAVAVGSGPNNQDEYDNARYVGPTVGTAAALAAAIADASNWESTNDSQTAPTRDWATNGVARFTLVPEPTTWALWGLGFLALAAGSRCRGK